MACNTLPYKIAAVREAHRLGRLADRQRRRRSGLHDGDALDPDRQHRLEAPLLDRYHDGLLAYGVSGYDRAALARDYRLATLRMIMWPLSQAIADIPPVIWWNNLERILLAVDDLGCRELLG
jgi:hypothetical protein